LALNICRLISDHMQTPLSYSTCIAVGTTAGALGAGSYARVTFGDGIWTMIGLGRRSGGDSFVCSSSIRHARRYEAKLTTVSAHFIGYGPYTSNP
jgi:hypothetical protein